MSATFTRTRLRVVLCTHLHQPLYRDAGSGRQVLPWAYLHALQEYADLTHHLEIATSGTAVLNLSPVLLEQLDDYGAALSRALRGGPPPQDPVLALLTPAGRPLDSAAWPPLLRAVLDSAPPRIANRFPPYQRLLEMAQQALANGTSHWLSPGFLRDLAAWHHLAWCGESTQADERVAGLIAHGLSQGPVVPARFGEEDLRLLLEVVTDVVVGLVPRWRRLLGSGRIELSASPWGHPLLPAMLGSVAELPDLYPGGPGRAKWHLARAQQAFVESFGVRARGGWLPGGAVCAKSLAALGGFGQAWTLTGEEVIRDSLKAGAAGAVFSSRIPARAWRVAGVPGVVFTRHSALSSLATHYAGWDAARAATNFVEHLARVAREHDDDPHAVVAVVLGGDRADWPDGGFAFVSHLLARLDERNDVELTTFSAVLAEPECQAELPLLVPGSWESGGFASWARGPERQSAWRALCGAKQAFDQAVVEGTLDDAEQARAELQLAACEAADFPWWLGEERPALARAAFGALFLAHLRHLYRLLDEPVPGEVEALASMLPSAPEVAVME